MSLTDYEKTFDRLTYYASHLVDTEAKKTRRFEQELHPDVSMILMSRRFTFYCEMAERAHVIWYQKASFEKYSQKTSSKYHGQASQLNKGFYGKRIRNNQDKGKKKVAEQEFNTG
ncbi:Pepsin-retropepsin like protein [Abeliophyllum distichum]|uniref:Pepsin-retropepsin like protein n=1 Tax=Abeliophyllum distichum TaxID=126358 RepID=A0ABD1U107_9LAMI